MHSIKKTKILSPFVTYFIIFAIIFGLLWLLNGNREDSMFPYDMDTSKLLRDNNSNSSDIDMLIRS